MKVDDCSLAKAGSAAALFLSAVCAGPVAVANDLPRVDPPSRPWFNLDFGGPKVRFESLLGLSVTSSADYLGASQRSTTVRPLAAVRIGRIQLATSGSSSLLGFGGVAEEAGASLDLATSSRWKLRTGLRLTSGRDTRDAGELAGLPDIRKTVVGRLAVSYTITPRLRAVSALNLDLLGRGTGLFWTNGLDYRKPLGKAAELKLGAGFTYGNATHLQTYYGVPEQSVTANRGFYAPGAGLKDAALSATVTRALSREWIAFGGLNYARLLGEAADSPIAYRRDNFSAVVGLGWRYGR